jgi:hypothetical protein
MRTEYTIALTLFLATTCQAQLVINELDYDQPSTDVAEFLEIKNAGNVPFDLQNLTVLMVNGSNGGAAIYQNITSTAWPTLAPGEYFVICGNAANTVNCDHVGPVATNLIQNGVPDAIALVNNATSDTMDVLSYGGAVPGYSEGIPTTALDVNMVDGRSLSRWPDGSDTDDNDTDFRLGCSTPGEPNNVDPVNCDIPSVVNEVPVATTFLAVMDPVRDVLQLQWSLDNGRPVNFEVFNIAGSRLAGRQLSAGRPAVWELPLASLRGQLLLVRASSGDAQQVKRIAIP